MRFPRFSQIGVWIRIGQPISFCAMALPCRLFTSWGLRMSEMPTSPSTPGLSFRGPMPSRNSPSRTFLMSWGERFFSSSLHELAT